MPLHINVSLPTYSDPHPLRIELAISKWSSKLTSLSICMYLYRKGQVILVKKTRGVNYSQHPATKSNRHFVSHNS